MRSWIEKYQVLAVAIATAALFTLWYLRLVWAIALIGLIIAAALLPVIDWLVRRRIPRALAILLTYVLLIGILVGIFAPAIVTFISQSAGLSQDLVFTLQKLLAPGSFLSHFGLTPESVVSSVEGSVVPFTTSAVAALAGTISAIVISIYALYDWHSQEAHGSSRAQHFLTDAQRELGAWARGQLLLCLSIGVITFIALVMLGIPYAGPLAALAGFLELIPYAGPIISSVPAIMLGLDASVSEGIAVLVVYIVIQQLEGHLFVPLIMKNAVRVHPVVIILSLLVGYEIMGIVGAIIAVPIVSIARLALQRLDIIKS